jgi:hypothetical protein
MKLSGHQRIDARSLAMHRAIAGKVRANPQLVEVARDNIRRWSTTGAASPTDYKDWLDLLVDEGEWMTATRQIGPFAGILTPQERWAIYAQFAPDKVDQ